MQSISLARAKIQTPRFRSGLIERSDLEQRLGDALATRRLVLLVAPAGYGKTAALSRQLQRLPPNCAVAWLTVDEEDDLQRLFSHLVEALEPFDPPWRLAPEALLELVAQGLLRDAASALLNALEATEVAEGVIVLDDLHAVADPRVFEFLGHVLEGLPLKWTLVIASRVEPPLALARWRARREVAEFDETILSFSRKEVRDLWRYATGQDDPALAELLLESTQGWPAGLCLNLEASKRSAATTSKPVGHNRRHLFDYLANEVLKGLPNELQEFLLRCSVLPELTVARCRQVSGNARAAELLEDIERRRLFTSVLDSEEVTLRLHNLFRDFLEENLRRLHPKEVPALLHLAAAGEADPVRRTLMFLRAGAWDDAQQGLADATPEMLARDEGAQVIRMVKQFPVDFQARSPLLSYVRGLCAWPPCQYGEVRSAMEHAVAGFDALGRPDEAQRARAMQALALHFSGHMEDARRLGQLVRSRPMDLETETLGELLDFWYEGHNGPADGPGRRLARMVDLLMRGASAELWSRCMPRVYMFVGRPGVSAQIERLVNGAMAAAGDGHWSLQANANLMEAWMFLWQGRIAQFEAALPKIEDDSKWLGQSAASRIRVLTLKANYQLICDDRDALRASRDAIIAQASQLDFSSDLPLGFLSIAVRISAAIDDWQIVRMHLPELQAKIDRQTPAMQMFIRIFTAQLALHEGRVDEALDTLRAIVARSAVLDTYTLDATARTRLALAELANGSPAAGWQALQPLIERVEASGNLGQVLIMGLQKLTELSLAPWGEAAPKEQLAVLRQWVEASKRFRGGSHENPRVAAGNDAGLSDRELEVLALLADGQSNKLIARALDLSPHTVKRHVARILDRLDLSSRMQAAQWYRTHFEYRAAPDS